MQKASLHQTRKLNLRLRSYKQLKINMLMRGLDEHHKESLEVNKEIQLIKEVMDLGILCHL